MVINRKIQHFNTDGTLREEEIIEVEWDEVRKERKRWLEITDLWYFKDRWDALSSTKKGQLNTFRQKLRDLPENYATANEAADNFPEPQGWF
jgi:hypothetical protein